MRVFISPGNSKIGKMWNFSFPPVMSCRPDVPCRKRCYMRHWNIWPTVKAVWLLNWRGYRRNPAGFIEALLHRIRELHPPVFRWFVGGDIPDNFFLAGMIRIAEENPETKFFGFTKNHTLKYEGLPDNLILRTSMWPGWVRFEESRAPRAWMQDGSETRVPDGTFECRGSCPACRFCWTHRGSVVFHKH